MLFVCILRGTLLFRIHIIFSILKGLLPYQGMPVPCTLIEVGQTSTKRLHCFLNNFYIRYDTMVRNSTEFVIVAVLANGNRDFFFLA